MAKLRQQGSDFSLSLSEREAMELGLEAEKEYELNKARDGIWVLSQKQSEKKEPVIIEPVIDGKIIELMKRKSLSERVEGKFEKLLNEQELIVFKKMLAEGKIIAFKLSDKYKKAVYKIALEKNKESESTATKEKPIEEYDLEKDGFLVVKNEERAKRLSEELKEEIKQGKIRGIKSFDGHFYIIESSLLEKYSDDTCTVIKANKSILLPELAQKLSVSSLLAKIVCEFLKEDGEIIEKRKESYQLV